MKSIAVCLSIAGLAAVLGACSQTRYAGYGKVPEEANPFSRTVEYEVTGAFYEDPPTCATVLPFAGDGPNDPRAPIVEESLARQLSARLTRVIGPRMRDRLVRDLAVDLGNPRDRKAFASGARCGAFVESKPWGGEGVFAVFWTQERIGIEVRMVRASDGEVLWRARHVATRSKGGLPLSPISAVYDLVTVGDFKTDRDLPYSLVDDATRRLVATIPDTRVLGMATMTGRR